MSIVNSWVSVSWGCKTPLLFDLLRSASCENYLWAFSKDCWSWTTSKMQIILVQASAFGFQKWTKRERAASNSIGINLTGPFGRLSQKKEGSNLVDPASSICLSWRLSHACLSISYIRRNCEWLIKTVIVYLMMSFIWITVGNQS